MFDAGIGGLSVLRVLREKLPGEQFRYLADLENIPYGTKPPHAVSKICSDIVSQFLRMGAKLIVVACNTADAASSADLRTKFPAVPVIGVIEPGAAAACEASRNGHIAVIGTEGTIRSASYTRAIHALRPEARVSGIPCPLLSHVAEAVLTDADLVERIVAYYLKDVFSAGKKDVPDTLVLGCTHFPLLMEAFQKLLPDTTIVDPAYRTADTVKNHLETHGMLNAATNAGRPDVRYFSSADKEQLAKGISVFMRENPRECEIQSFRHK